MGKCVAATHKRFSWEDGGWQEWDTGWRYLGSCPIMERFTGFPPWLRFHWGKFPGRTYTLSLFCRAHLVPSYSFGENEVHNQETFPEGTWLRFFQKAFQETFKKILGLNFCTFHGRGLTKESWGFLPFNRPITTVGKISSISEPPWSLIPISSPRGPGTQLWWAMESPLGVVEGRVGRTTEQVRVMAIHSRTEFNSYHESIIIPSALSWACSHSLEHVWG